MQQRRLLVIPVAATVGGVFAAGLFLHGRVGGGLLALTDLALIGLAVATWPRLRPVDRAIRVAVIAVIAALAIAKLVG